ncbi:hypothetical protein [Streptomyces sp. NPDC002573]|uniref:hypothetical protein n=1 Tax=Streptomyces sp. NPDC002573 TaxID=3364651 RepID=UPI00367C124B
MSIDRTPESGGENGTLRDLCDVCGEVVLGRTFYALVPDSSAVHPVDPRLDGTRLLVGCSRGHLAALVDQYEDQTFMPAELWAGKIARTLRQHPKGISEADLARETGLTRDQVRLGVIWQNTQAQCWLEQRRRDEDDGPDTRQ